MCINGITRYWGTQNKNHRDLSMLWTYVQPQRSVRVKAQDSVNISSLAPRGGWEQ